MRCVNIPVVEIAHTFTALKQCANLGIVHIVHVVRNALNNVIINTNNYKAIHANAG